jgi:hypothetical protein
MNSKTVNGANTKAPRKNKINALDIFIIILVIASIAGIVYRQYTSTLPTKTDEEAAYEVYFSVKNISFTTPEYLSTNDKVYFETGEFFGNLLNNNDTDTGSPLVVTPASVVLTDENGNYVSTMYPDGSRVDANGSILCRCVRTADGRYLLGGTKHITPGETILVRTELVDLQIVITSVADYVE